MVVSKDFVRTVSFLILVFYGTLGLSGQAPRFSFSGDTVHIRHLDNTVANSFQIYKGELENEWDVAGLKPIIGDTRYKNAYTSFIPRVPLQEETVYSLVYCDSIAIFEIPTLNDGTAFEIVAIYPKSERLPANFLKWYVRFNDPVNPSKIYEHLSILDDEGNPVDRALLNLTIPLLSNDGRTLTVWVEPGRQKRDLGPNRILGPVLEQGRTYTLTISEDLKNTNGRTLESSLDQTFTVVPSDRSRPQISEWKLTLPNAKTKQELRILFNEPMDFGSLRNAIQLLSSDGAVIAGQFYISDEKVIFSPVNPWEKDTYSIRFDPRIEDLAGNNLSRLFDREIKVISSQPLVQLDFEIF